DIDVTLFNDVENELGFSWDRDATFRRVAIPRPAGVYSYANHITLAYPLNGQWWGLTTQAFDCRTTSTTT
ncbi:MAG TPA: hypothetical protein DDY91_23940, partial [Planctomycetaceae bacterium]|nr:hypothetical protein [Planctomycetaceae bacterium]